ncbi:MAG TPA: hypothetical protein PKE63_01010 [Lacibacter sp.]|nr:hypothetical protein [Lacibacter sp.]HMO89955.1 hypothetical protein [Lacibacter sp.]HMP85820.1 hypothetical protein [Lacibacter sp.]
MPGEFEPHEAVWFGTWYMSEWESDYKRVMTDVMKAINGHVAIKIAAASEYFLPNLRKIFVCIDAMNLNWGRGGIHCSTQQEPKKNEL